MINYQIKKITQIETHELSSFYKKVFGERSKFLAKNWSWLYRVNYNDAEPLILINDNKIIGQLGLIPVKLRMGDKVISATWFVDFIIAQEFQGKGAGSYLVKEAMKMSSVQMAFSNQNALPVYKKFKWSSISSMKRLGRPINPIKWMPYINNSNLRVFKTLYNFNLRKKLNNLVSVAPHSFNNNSKIFKESFLKRKILQKENLEIKKDEDWFNWRLEKCPYINNIKFFEYKNNFAITHVFKDKNKIRLNIIYHYFIDEDLKIDLYNQIAKWAIENDIDLIWGCSNDGDFINSLKNIFPSYLLKPLTFVAYSSEKSVYEKLKYGFKNIQGIDSDVDALPLIE